MLLKMIYFAFNNNLVLIYVISQYITYIYSLKYHSLIYQTSFHITAKFHQQSSKDRKKKCLYFCRHISCSLAISNKSEHILPFSTKRTHSFLWFVISRQAHSFKPLFLGPLWSSTSQTASRLCFWGVLCMIFSCFWRIRQYQKSKNANEYLFRIETI